MNGTLDIVRFDSLDVWAFDSDTSIANEFRVSSFKNGVKISLPGNTSSTLGLPAFPQIQWIAAAKLAELHHAVL